MKICCSCNAIKQLSDFAKDKNKADGHSYKCKLCNSAYARKWREANAESFKQTLRENYLKNKEDRLLKAKQWREDNRELKREYNRKRKAAARGNGYEPYSDRQVLETYGTVCYLCGREIDLDAPRWTSIPGWENGLHIDHFIPISKGGPDKIENVRPTHGLCNLIKNSNMV